MRRHKHSLSHYRLASMNMGNLVPIAWYEALPGDTIQQATHAFIRLSPMVAPVMHPVYAKIYHFFVPNRLIWDDFEDFITGGPLGIDDGQNPFMVTSRANLLTTGGLGDHLGLPPVFGAATNVSALPFRAYALIWNEFFRDQDLQSELTIDRTALVTGDTTTNITLQRVNWEKDYFTTARPWEQKGANLSVPVSSTDSNIQVRTQTDPTNDRLMQAFTSGNLGYAETPVGATTGVRFGTDTGLQVWLDLLREGFALQRYEEARARYGSRYTEYLRYLGVRSSDARLQRPEYLGGGRRLIQFSEVLQTAEGTDPVGDLKGHGIGAMSSNRYRRFFEEHGIVMTLMCVIPKAIYMDSVERQWLRISKEDYWQRELQFIGQQEVYNVEVDSNTASGTALGTFGYQDRYDEYRRKQSSVSGEFRTSTLDYWHFGRDWGGGISLNSAFVTCNPTERPFAVPSQDVIYVEAHHSIQARRMVAASGGRSMVF